MKFVAYERTLQGTGASRRLRNAHKVPGIVYGTGKASMIELDHNALFFALKKEAFHSSLLDMELGGKTEQVLLRDYQMHPFRPMILHADFQRVDANRKIHMKVPLHFVNAEVSPAVKTKGAIVSHVMTDIDVTCLPKDLPEFIEVDLSELDTGHSLHLSGIQLPSGVTAIVRGTADPVVATAVVPKALAEADETAATAEGAEAAPAAGADAKAGDAKAAEKGGEKKDDKKDDKKKDDKKK